MSRSCTAEEMNGLFGPGVFFENQHPEDIRVFSPFSQKYIVLEDLVIPLGEKVRTVIGSDPAACDMVLVGSRVSRRHAEIVYHDGCYFIQDLGSAHGTYINGRKISGMAELRTGDEIMLKPYRMTFTSSPADDSLPTWSTQSV